MTRTSDNPAKVRTAFGLLLAALLGSCSSAPQTAPVRPQPEPVAAQPAATPYGEEFWSVWGDAKAEMSTYELTTKAGKGVATLVFAAGQFSKSAGVEAHPTGQGGSDVFPVMKLNTIRRTPAESRMVTVFTTLTDANGLPAGAANYITFTTQSPAGHSWAEMTLRSSEVRVATHSFRAGEVRRTLASRNDLVAADALPLIARRIAWPRLRLGQNYAAYLLSSLDDAQPVEGIPATFSITRERETATVPAGSFRVHVFRVVPARGPTRTWYVETEPPHRIVRWEFEDGEQAGLVSSDRVKHER